MNQTRHHDAVLNFLLDSILQNHQRAMQDITIQTSSVIDGAQRQVAERDERIHQLTEELIRERTHAEASQRYIRLLRMYIGEADLEHADKEFQKLETKRQEDVDAAVQPAPLTNE